MDLKSLSACSGRPLDRMGALRSHGEPAFRSPAEARSFGFGTGAPAMPGIGLMPFLPTPVLSNVPVTPELSLMYAAVYGCVNVIATDCAALPREVKRKLPGGGRETVSADPRHDLVYCEPNADVSAFTFFCTLHLHRLLWGNGYAEIVRDRDGLPVALHLLSPRPGDTYPVRLGGRLFYKVNGGRDEISAEDVLHLAGLSYDGLSGLSPVALQRQAIGLGIAQEQFGASFYGNGSSPKGAITVNKRLTPEGIRNLRESFEAVHQGTVNANRLAVFEEGTAWQQISVNPVDAQYLESRKFQVIEICRIYRVPPHKIGDLSEAHLANLEASNLDYLNNTLGPELSREKQELDRKLFTASERASGLHVDHDLKSLFRGDSKSRAAYYQQRVATNSITPDEIREAEGENPLPNGIGKRVYAQMQVVPLGSAAPAPGPPDGKRYNPYHGPDGKFTSAHGGGKHGKIIPNPSKPGSLKDQIDALGARRNPSAHADHDAGFVGEIPTKLIHFDPDRFQYKLGAQGEHGVTDALGGVKKWDPNLGGILQTWKDPGDKKTYVVNGHHRLDLANKLGAEKVAVRYVHAKDAQEARAIGALTNIAEGRGTSLDAAKFFRDSGLNRDHLEAKGIPMRERVATEGVALANLHKPIFDRVLNGDITPARGAIIGDGLTHAQQASVVKALDKFGKTRQPSDAALRQTVLHARHAPTTKVKTHDLFGDNEEDVSLAFHRGEASAHVMERLSRERRVFGTVAKERNASELERGGNLINAAESGKISHAAARNLDTFTLLQHRSGPVSKLLNEAAERVHGGENKRKVHEDVYRRLPSAVEEALSGG